MATFFKISNGDLIPLANTYGAICVLASNTGGYAVCVGGRPISEPFDTEGEARLLQSKIAEKLKEGGDTILVIDDY